MLRTRDDWGYHELVIVEVWMTVHDACSRRHDKHLIIVADKPWLRYEFSIRGRELYKKWPRKLKVSEDHLPYETRSHREKGKIGRPRWH
jgi:hypothetical protein